jgi:hypothetical protein
MSEMELSSLFTHTTCSTYGNGNITHYSAEVLKLRLFSLSCCDVGKKGTNHSVLYIYIYIDLICLINKEAFGRTICFA